MSELAERFISSLINSGDTGEYIKLGNIESVFEHVKSDKKLHSKLHAFIQEYGKLPEKDTFEDIIGKDLPKAKETPKYYFDKLMERHIKKTMILSSQIASDHLQEKNVQAAFDELRKMVDTITLQKMAPQLFDFRLSHDLLAHELEEKSKPDYGIKFGWETLDDMTGGARAGDFISIIGRPAQGKSQSVLYSAMYAWEKQGKSPLFISMEMNPTVIFERLASLQQHIPYNRVRLGEFTSFKTNQRKKFLDGLLNLQRGNLPPFWVVDGNLTATIGDIINITNHLKPDVVFVDGAYLVEAEGKRTQDKIPQVCKGLKMEIATNMGVPVVTSWQFNREATKLRKSQKAGMEHIGGSDYIPQISSIALAMDQEDSVETIRQRVIRIMKGRNGEAGQFTINWDWNRMNFEEVPKIQDHEIMVS